MNALEVYDHAASSVANLVIERAGQRVSSGSGFIVSGKLVTAAHVVNVPPDCSLNVLFEKAEEFSTRGWSYGNNGAPFGGYSDEHSYDYALLTPPVGTRLPSGLDWADEIPAPGEPVCALGYPFEDPHLTLHQGHVSAVYKSGLATLLKLDMSVNPSNSGGAPSSNQ